MIKKFNKKPLQKNIDNAINAAIEDKNNAIAYVYKNAKIKLTGPLAGVPITIKDNIATKDAPTQASSKLLENFFPGYDATVVKLLKQSGASIIAKTNLDELALGGTGLYSCNGKIYNPLNSKRMIGGSSSGAAATFNNLIGVAIGSDTGDSVRLPASYIGVVGFKPTYGAVSRYGLFSYATSLDNIGWFTHNVYDSAIVASILFKKDEKDLTSKSVNFNLKNVKAKKPISIAYICNKKNIEKYMYDSMISFIEKVKKQGIKTKKVNIDNNLLRAIKPTYQIISFSEVASIDSNLTGLFFGHQHEGKDWESTIIKSRKEGLGKIAARRMILGSLFLERENQQKLLVKAQKIRRIIVDKFTKILKSFDILLLPSSIGVAPLISNNLLGISDISNNSNIYDSILAFSNFAGTPSITIKFDTYKKLPYGINLNSYKFNDEKLLSHAMWIEEFLEGKHE